MERWERRAPGGHPWRAGRRCHPGINKEAFDADIYVIYRAHSVVDRKQESGHWYPVFADSTSAIERIRTDTLGPGQLFAVARIKACSSIMRRDNDVTVRWVPAHQGVEGNERADELAKAVTEGESLADAVPDEYRWETGLSRMIRVATENRTRATTQYKGEVII